MLKFCRTFLALSCLLSGCSQHYVLCEPTELKIKTSYAYGSTDGISKIIERNSGGLNLNLSHIELKLGPTIYKNDSIIIDLMVGPILSIPKTDVSNTATGIILSPRVIAEDLGGGLKPFVSLNIGLGFYRWPPQGGGKDFNFILNPEFGFLVPISEKISYSLSYSLFHISNAKIFRPNMGWNSSMVIFGLEFKL